MKVVGNNDGPVPANSEMTPDGRAVSRVGHWLLTDLDVGPSVELRRTLEVVLGVA